MNKQEAIDFSKQYIEDIISFFGVNVAVTAEFNDEVIEISVPSTNLNSLLIGHNAETLRSLQYLVSTVLRNKNAEVSRVNIDIADYKKQRAERVAKQAQEWIEEVRRTGTSHVAHLNAADRRIVHGVAAEFPDIRTFSEGEGRDRVITIAQISS